MGSMSTGHSETTWDQAGAAPEQLKETLNSHLEGLEATYERILWAIDGRRAEGILARRTPVWLVVALEPLRLAQIVDGLSVSHGQSTGSDTRWL